MGWRASRRADHRRPQVVGVDLGTVRLPAIHERASPRWGRHRVPDDDHGRLGVTGAHPPRDGAQLHLRHPRQQRMALRLARRRIDRLSNRLGAQRHAAGAGAHGAPATTSCRGLPSQRGHDPARGQQRLGAVAPRGARPRRAHRNQRRGLRRIRRLQRDGLRPREAHVQSPARRHGRQRLSRILSRLLRSLGAQARRRACNARLSGPRVGSRPRLVLR